MIVDRYDEDQEDSGEEEEGAWETGRVVRSDSDEDSVRGAIGVIDEEEEESARARAASRTHQVVSRPRCRLTPTGSKERVYYYFVLWTHAAIAARCSEGDSPQRAIHPIDGPYKASKKHNPI